MDSLTKKRHECIKRFLLFNSGKELKYPIHSCFVRNMNLENNNCSRNSNREERDRTGNGGDNCYGCSFARTFHYFSDAIKYYKAMILTAMNEDVFIREGYSPFYDWARCDSIELLKNLLLSTQTMCYLTFKESDRRALYDVLCSMKPKELIKTISDICDFCDENNIK